MSTRHRETKLFIQDHLFSNREAENGVPMWIGFSRRVKCGRDRHAIQPDRVKTDSNQQLAAVEMYALSGCSDDLGRECRPESFHGLHPGPGEPALLSGFRPRTQGRCRLWVRVEVVAHCALRPTPGVPPRGGSAAGRAWHVSSPRDCERRPRPGAVVRHGARAAERREVGLRTRHLTS